MHNIKGKVARCIILSLGNIKMGGILFNSSYNVTKKTLLPPSILTEAVTEWIRSIQSKKMSGAFAMATPPVPSAEADGRDWAQDPLRLSCNCPHASCSNLDSLGCMGKGREELPKQNRQGRILGMTLAWMLLWGCSTSPNPGQMIQTETAGPAKRAKKGPKKSASRQKVLLKQNNCFGMTKIIDP